MTASGKAPRTASANTRLLETAVEQFGRKGLEGASTRAIATEAGTAMSSITYHYGGKHGLYLAAARHIAESIAQRFTAAMAGAPELAGLDAEAAFCEIRRTMDTILHIMLAPESRSWARFIIREQAEPTEAFDIIYDGIFAHVAGRLLALVRICGAGRWSDEETRLKAVALFGQVLVYRVARETVLRVTGWDDIGAAQEPRIRATLHAHFRAILDLGPEGGRA